MFFLLLQVTVTLTAGEGREGRRRRSRSTGFRSSSAAAREPTRRQCSGRPRMHPELFFLNFFGLFCNFQFV